MKELRIGKLSGGYPSRRVSWVRLSRFVFTCMQCCPRRIINNWFGLCLHDITGTYI
jgi:hypothetical protein